MQLISYFMLMHASIISNNHKLNFTYYEYHFCHLELCKIMILKIWPTIQ